jgi:hypothetical protein
MQLLISTQAGHEDTSTLPLLLCCFGDVHALLTSPTVLQSFLHLPYTAIKAWAGSDDLVVDSENSVAVALGAWIEGAEHDPSRACSREQKQELSGLLRAMRLTPGETCEVVSSSMQRTSHVFVLHQLPTMYSFISVIHQTSAPYLPRASLIAMLLCLVHRVSAVQAAHATLVHAHV